MDLKPGQTLGSYRITERLVTGGMAKVYRAQQPSTGRDVALKVMTLESDAKVRARFEREAQLLAHLQHPHILGLIDAGHEGDWHYLVVPLVRCGDLADLIAREDGPLPLPVLRRTALQLCAALEYAHGQGVIHRDVKPANILLDERGNCVLTDFGIALAEGAQRLTLVGFAIGTPEYLAPEQGSGQDDARSDLYSLGVVLFEMATGRLPFTASTPIDWLRAHHETPVPQPRSLNAALPEGLEKVILKALAKDPNERFQNAGQFSTAIREALPESIYGEDSALNIPRDSIVTAGPPADATRKKVARALATVIAIAALVAIGVWRPWQTTPTNPSVVPVAATPATQAPTGASQSSTTSIAAIATAPAQSASSANLYDGFDDPQYDHRFNSTRWHLTKSDARMQMEQHDGALHIRSQERENGIYAEFPATRLACISARLRLDKPILASAASIGVSLSRLDHPDEWVSCYLYATRGALIATPMCTDQRRQEFRTGVASTIGTWHDVSVRLNPDSPNAAFSIDGGALGELPYPHNSTTTWYVLLSGWSADGEPVVGAVDNISVKCAH